MVEDLERHVPHLGVVGHQVDGAIGDALRLCAEIAPITDPNMVSDVGTGALLANAGAQAAAYNVRINLPHITDQDFEAETHTTLTRLLEECSELAAAVAAEVERSLGS